MLAALLGVWLLASLLGLALRGVRPDLGTGPFGSDGLALAALGLLGLGGLTASAALSLPGRDRLAGAGQKVAFLGAALALGCATWLLLGAPTADLAVGATAHLACLAVACAVGLAPALAVVSFARRAAPFRPVALALLAAAGATALGTIAAHTSCPYGGPEHLALGHIAAPFAGVLLMTLPLVAALRRNA